MHACVANFSEAIYLRAYPLPHTLFLSEWLRFVLPRPSKDPRILVHEHGFYDSESTQLSLAQILVLDFRSLILEIV